jgi:hypothetical protein
VAEFRLRVIGDRRTIHNEQMVQSFDGGELWRAVAYFAARYGRDGEYVQVFDQDGDMVIRAGVATARSSLVTGSVAA